MRKKKKKNNTEHSPKVFMSRPKSNLSIERRKKKKKIFKKDKNKKYKKGKSKRKINTARIFFYIVTPLFFLSLLYISIVFVINIRSKGDIYETQEEYYVIGIDDLPAYPGSSFIFSNNINEPSVANFISSGNSAYRLPYGKSISNVYEHYEKILPEKGWIHALSVPVGSEEMKSGEYWVKDNRGLRLYTKFNDIWYQLITVDQAFSGLRDIVEREIQRDLLLSSEEPQDLLPDYPWVIQIPIEYIISYSASDYENLRSVDFRKVGTNEKVSVVPIGKTGGVLDNYLRDYVDILNSNDEENNWTIENTILAYTSFGTALKGTIVSNGNVHDIAVVTNTYDKVVYVMDSNTIDNPFFDYVFSNIKPPDFVED